MIGDDLPLEIRHNTVIPLQPFLDGDPIDSSDYRYKGHAGPLYIVLPTGYRGAKAAMILGSFSGYHDFDESKLSDRFLLYRGN